MKNLYQNMRWVYWSIRRAWCLAFHFEAIENIPDYRTEQGGYVLTCVKCVHMIKQLPA
jgi:hypothetical protein